MISIKTNIGPIEIACKLNEYFKRKEPKLFSIKTGNKVEYSEVLENETDLIVGSFAKAYAEWGEIRIYTDVVGEGAILFSIEEDKLIIYESSREVDRNKHPIISEKIQEVYEKDGFVKSEKTVFRGVYKTSPFSYLVMDQINGSFKIKPTALSVIPILKEKSRSELIGMLNKICNATVENSILLYSGGSDSRLIYELSEKKNELGYFNFDSDYEPNNYDQHIIESQIQAGVKINKIIGKASDVIKYLESSKYMDALLEIIGYDHPCYAFDLMFKAIENNIVVSGQNADTIAFFGPSERLRCQNFRPRNIRSLIARLRLLPLLLNKNLKTSNYFRIYNDKNYAFNNDSEIKDEILFLNEFLSKNKSILDNWYFLLTAKMRAFGSGADINAQKILAIKNGKSIRFPLNNLVFSELSRRSIHENLFKYLINPKHWYMEIYRCEVGVSDFKPSGVRDYTKTRVFKSYKIAKDKFITQTIGVKW